MDPGFTNTIKPFQETNIKVKGQSLLVWTGFHTETKNILIHLMGNLKEVSPLQHHIPYLFQRLSELVETLTRRPATILPGFLPMGGASLSINPVFYSIISYIIYYVTSLIIFEWQLEKN